MTTLITIGYEGRNPEGLMERLLVDSIEVLVDVRQRAGSRKPGFNKSQLIRLTRDYGIRYEHLPKLGTPAILRKQLRSGVITRSTYLDFYRLHLIHQQDQIATLVKLAESAPCCLMCFERDPADCHRSVLATLVAKQATGRMDVEHIVGY